MHGTSRTIEALNATLKIGDGTLPVVDKIKAILSPAEFRLFVDMVTGHCVTRPGQSESAALTRRVLIAGMRVKFRKAKLPLQIEAIRQCHKRPGRYDLVIVPTR
jgi:hypothetical protein